MTHSAVASVPPRMALPSLCAARLGSRYFGDGGGFAQGHEAQRQRRRFLAPDPDRTVQDACVCGGGESGQQIERLAFWVEPARGFPAGAHDEIGALFTHTRQPIGMHEAPVGNENVPCGDGRAIKLFAAHRERQALTQRSRHKPLFCFAVRPTFGTVVPSIRRMRRPCVAGSPPSNWPTKCSSQASQLCKRCNSATLEKSASWTDAAQALVDRRPIPPRQ